jgi:hypothetical protein
VNFTVMERSVSSAMAGAAQLRAFGNFCCWCSKFIQQTVTTKNIYSDRPPMPVLWLPVPVVLNDLVKRFGKKFIMKTEGRCVLCIRIRVQLFGLF